MSRLDKAWKPGPAPRVEGLFWVAGEAGWPTVSCFRRTARFAEPYSYDPKQPMKPIKLVYGWQRIDPGAGHHIGDWTPGDDLPYPGTHYIKIPKPRHPLFEGEE